MKRLLLQSVLAGALAFLLVRLPLDYLTLAGGGAELDAAALASWIAAGAAALLVLAGVPLMKAGSRAWRAQDAQWRETAVAASSSRRDGAWRPRANPYAVSAQRQPAARRARKIAAERMRRRR